jgi:hypothetical protein
MGALPSHYSGGGFFWPHKPSPKVSKSQASRHESIKVTRQQGERRVGQYAQPGLDALGRGTQAFARRLDCRAVCVERAGMVAEPMQFGSGT